MKNQKMWAPTWKRQSGTKRIVLSCLTHTFKGKTKTPFGTQADSVSCLHFWLAKQHETCAISPDTQHALVAREQFWKLALKINAIGFCVFAHLLLSVFECMTFWRRRKNQTKHHWKKSQNSALLQFPSRVWWANQIKNSTQPSWTMTMSGPKMSLLSLIIQTWLHFTGKFASADPSVSWTLHAHTTFVSWIDSFQTFECACFIFRH